MIHWLTGECRALLVTLPAQPVERGWEQLTLW